MKKRLFLALGLAALIGAGVFASAATLGGITDKNLGASDQVVASCDTDGVTTSYTTRTYADAVSPGVTPNTTGVNWEVATIKVSSIDAACSGEEIKAVIAGADGVDLYASPGDLLGTSGEFVLSVPATTHVPAEDVYHVGVVIAGVVAAA